MSFSLKARADRRAIVSGGRNRCGGLAREAPVCIGAAVISLALGAVTVAAPSAAFAEPQAATDHCPNAHVRQQTGAALLLDCRAYELASAADTGGYDVESSLVPGQTPFSGYPEAKEPSRILYGVHEGAIPNTGHPTNDGLDAYVATRGPEGWSTKYVGIPANDPSAKGPFASTLLEADASLDTLAFGGEEICSPCFGPGQTETGEPIHLPNGELVQGMAGSIPQPKAKPEGYIGKDLSANGEHFIFGSKSQFEPEGNNNGTDLSIYDRNLKTEETKVVSKTPSGQTMSGSGIGELDISSDGSHILIGQLVSEVGNAKYWHLYMNVGDSSKTTELTPGAKEGVLFDGMTSDGTKVFFSSEEHLTNQDSAHSGPDIYMWEEGKPLTLISKGETETPGQPGDSSSCDPASNTKHVHWNTTGTEANCGDVAIGGGGGVASGDGTIYFLSPEQLDGSEGVPNAPNLYVVRPGGAPHFVATLESSANAALPEPQHPFLRSIGSFITPTGVAVEHASGDVYVLEIGNVSFGHVAYVSKFTDTGQPVLSFGVEGKISIGGAYTEFSIPGEIAVDQSTGDLYVPAPLEGTVKKFNSSGTNISEIKGVGLPTGVAVGSTGEVYVTGLLSGVHVFSSSGSPINSFSTIEYPTGVAVGPDGRIYVVDGGTLAGNGTTEVYEASGNDLGQLTANPSQGVAVDPSTGNVYVDEGNQVAEFDPSGDSVGAPIGAGLLSGSIGLAADSDSLYVSNSGKTNLASYGPAVIPADPNTDNPMVVDSVSTPGVSRSGDFELTPSGEFAVFTSTLPLTGYDSAGHREVFRDAPTEDRIECASCNPNATQATADSTLVPNGLSLSEDGRVFFNSLEGIIPRDLNEREDAYEWEPDGTEAVQGAEPCDIPGGCVDLISTGNSPFGSRLLSVSADGTDAYFFTRDKLVEQDENGNTVKIYDARSLGGFPYSPPEIQCKASDECHGAGSEAPPPPSIASEAGAPTTNSVAPMCKAGFRKSQGKCVSKRRTTVLRHGHSHTKTRRGQGGRRG